MQNQDDPTRDKSGLEPHRHEPDAERPFSIANVCVVAIMLIVALGAVTIECGFYKAFDDNGFDLDRSALPSMLALFGSHSSPGSTTRPLQTSAGGTR